MIQTDAMVMHELEIASSIAVGESLIPLEYICPACRGQKQEKTCAKCNNIGTVPSPQGGAILGLISRHGGKK